MLPQPDAAARVVAGFNDCINRGDLAGLRRLMTEDHAFIDTGGRRVAGREAALRAWAGFFQAFPDYRNVFERVLPGDRVVAIAGRSTCSDPLLDGPALWSARVRAGRIAEWRVYDDTSSNRALLGL